MDSVYEFYESDCKQSLYRKIVSNILGFRLQNFAFWGSAGLGKLDLEDALSIMFVMISRCAVFELYLIGCTV